MDSNLFNETALAEIINFDGNFIDTPKTIRLDPDEIIEAGEMTVLERILFTLIERCKQQIKTSAMTMYADARTSLLILKKQSNRQALFTALMENSLQERLRLKDINYLNAICCIVLAESNRVVIFPPGHKDHEHVEAISWLNDSSDLNKNREN